MEDFVIIKIKCSRCRRLLSYKQFKGQNRTCKRCIKQVTLWNMANKSRYNETKSRSYYTNQEAILKKLRISRRKDRWKVSYHLAKQRCNNPKNPNYKYYGGRGIKFLMTLQDFKYLWDRDKGYNMSIPTIDRKDNDGNYTVDNCRFIEKSENTRKRNYERT